MRLRTSAALALVTALLAAPVSALACAFECVPGETAVQAVAAEGAADGTCHRELSELPAGTATVDAAPHDCGAHAPVSAFTANAPRETPRVRTIASAATPFATDIRVAGDVGGASTRCGPTSAPTPPRVSSPLTLPLRL